MDVLQTNADAKRTSLSWPSPTSVPRLPPSTANFNRKNRPTVPARLQHRRLALKNFNHQRALALGRPTLDFLFHHHAHRRTPSRLTPEQVFTGSIQTGRVCRSDQQTMPCPYQTRPAARHVFQEGAVGKPVLRATFRA